MPPVHSWENESEVNKEHHSIIMKIVLTLQTLFKGLKDFEGSLYD